MSGQNGGVSLYRVYRSDTPIHLGEGDTPDDTRPDTPSLKSLAGKYLSEEKTIQQAIQSPIQQGEKRIALISGADTPERVLFCHGEDEKTERKIDSSINESTPEQLAHARTLLVDCPVSRGKRHCWHCSRCGDARKCSAWRARAAYVESFRQSEKPYSLFLVESGAVEVTQ